MSGVLFQRVSLNYYTQQQGSLGPGGVGEKTSLAQTVTIRADAYWALVVLLTLATDIDVQSKEAWYQSLQL